VKTLLNALEARVLGCMMEKEVTTPDQYPLSLNALCNAVNQKSNRDPVLSLSESEVQDVVDQLLKKHLLTDKSGFGSRVAKYQHRFCNTEFSKLKLSPGEFGIVAVLMLRGPQTPGELRTRCERYHHFADAQEVEMVLEQLAAREDGALVEKLPRETGKRESRYMHLFADDEYVTSMRDAIHVSVSHHASGGSGEPSRIEALEARVEALEQQLAQLKQQLQ